jgi:hypothetical protein
VGDKPVAPRPAGPGRSPWWQRYGPDLLVAVVLLVVAFLARRHGLPTDGLTYDDTAPAAGAKGASSLSDLFAVGIDHPGFTAVLMGWKDLIGGSDASWTYPALIAGTLGPPLLYLALRWCGYERSISALLGAALAAAEADIVYSGQIRSYTTDLLIVLALAMIVPRLARMRWRWQTGVAWVIAATLVASFAGFALIAAAVAGTILVLHPRSDLRIRVAAVAAQAAASVALLVATSNSYNNAAARDTWRNSFDAYPDFHLNPFRTAGDVFVHLRRLAEAYPGRPSTLAAVCVVVALLGLVTVAWKGRQAIRARYLLLLLGVVIVASLLGLVPFGPTRGTFAPNTGHRISLWLIPVLAIGLAAALQGLRGLLPGRRALRIGFDAAAYLGAAAILVSAAAADQPPYSSGGQKSATDFVQSHLGKRDAVLVGFSASWSFAAESDFSYKVDPTSWSAVGYYPVFTDPQVHYLDVNVDPGHVAPEVKNAGRVFVYYENAPVEGYWPAGIVSRLGSTLRKLGFEKQPTVHFGVAEGAFVEVWHRRQPAPAAETPTTKAKPKPAPQAAGAGQQPSPSQINLRLSDFPHGWSKIAPLSASAPAIFNCLHISGAAPPNVVSFKASTSLFVSSQVIHWPSTAGAQRAYAALKGPRGARCLGSVGRSLTQNTSVPVSVTARKVPPPPAHGARAVAYEEVNRSSVGAVPVSRGNVVYLTRGKTGVLISSLAVTGNTIPSSLLPRLVATLAERVNGATP